MLTTLFKAVFINPEQVVLFFCCVVFDTQVKNAKVVIALLAVQNSL